MRLPHSLYLPLSYYYTPRDGDERERETMEITYGFNPFHVFHYGVFNLFSLLFHSPVHLVSLCFSLFFLTNSLSAI